MQRGGAIADVTRHHRPPPPGRRSPPADRCADHACGSAAWGLHACTGAPGRHPPWAPQFLGGTRREVQRGRPHRVRDHALGCVAARSALMASGTSLAGPAHAGSDRCAQAHRLPHAASHGRHGVGEVPPPSPLRPACTAARTSPVASPSRTGTQSATMTAAPVASGHPRASTTTPSHASGPHSPDVVSPGARRPPGSRPRR